MASPRPKPAMPWERYLHWWRTTRSNNSRDPNAPEYVVRRSYDRYRAKQQADMDHWLRYQSGLSRTDAEARIHEYEFTEALRGTQQIPASIEVGDHVSIQLSTDTANHAFDADYVLVHLDGDRNNNELSNLRKVPARQAMEEGLTLHNQRLAAQLNSGFTISEAAKMNLKVASVTFEQFSDTKKYEYLVPGDTTVNKEVPLYAVITRASVKAEELSYFAVARVVEVKDLIDAEYDGKIKHVVALFTAEDYNARIERQQKRERLLKQANKMAEEQHSIEKLTKLIGDSEEGKKLLAEIAALDNE